MGIVCRTNYNGATNKKSRQDAAETETEETEEEAAHKSQCKHTHTLAHTLHTHTYTHIGIETMVRILVFFGGFFLSFFWLDSRVHSTMNPHPWTHPPVRFDWLKTTTTTTIGSTTKLCNSLQHFAYVCGICFLLFPPVFFGCSKLFAYVRKFYINKGYTRCPAHSLSLSLSSSSVYLFILAWSQFVWLHFYFGCGNDNDQMP